MFAYNAFPKYFAKENVCHTLLNIVIKKYFSDVFKTLTVSFGKCFSNVAKTIFNDIVFLVLLKRFVNVIHPASKH